ncbi:BQ2448_2645 [Microbotryum intermedium]|uniref:BQ2448_2645 protein n=1 Tax=Microbotryum intermedium TaxID=269621 RepID=A0A238F8U7_9BASI|nr:BQ2448_2645 [Microbotryum intermedium]
MKSAFCLAFVALIVSTSAVPAGDSVKETRLGRRATPPVAQYKGFTAARKNSNVTCNAVAFKSFRTGNVRPLTFVLAESSKIVASARSGVVNIGATNPWVLQTVTSKVTKNGAALPFQMQVRTGKTFEVFGFFPNGTGKYLGNKFTVASGSDTCLPVPTCAAGQYYDPSLNQCKACKVKFANSATCTIAAPVTCTYGVVSLILSRAFARLRLLELTPFTWHYRQVAGTKCLPRVCTGDTYLSSNGAQCLTCAAGKYLNVPKTGCTACPGGMSSCKIFTVPFADGNVRCIGADSTSCLGPKGRIECPPGLPKNADGSCIAGRPAAFFPNSAVLSIANKIDTDSTVVLSECYDRFSSVDTIWATTSILGSVIGLANLCTAYQNPTTATILPSPVSNSLWRGTCKTLINKPAATLGIPSTCADTIYVENMIGAQANCYVQFGTSLVPCGF